MDLNIDNILSLKNVFETWDMRVQRKQLKIF